MTGEEQRGLYVEYYDRIVAYLVRLRFTVEEARDLTQEVFLSVITHVQEKPTAPWLFLKTAAHNRAVNVIRSRDIHRRSEIGSADALPQLAELSFTDFWSGTPSPSPESEAIQKEQAALLREAIENLPASMRPCVLYRMGGLSYEQIATTLDITPNAVKTRLRDAKKLLVERLSSGDR
jgi:RNA polymerase sigma-70 factor (ECF subfamily)